MKKLLVLLMVLGLATSAQASLSLRVDGSDVSEVSIGLNDTITISVVETESGIPWTGYLEIADPQHNIGYEESYTPVGAAWDNESMVTSGIGELGYADDDAYGSMGDWELNVGGITSLPVAGTQYSVDMECLALGTVYVTLYSDDWATVVDSIVITQIPEPMTMALLGLGGLFLRRRK